MTEERVGFLYKIASQLSTNQSNSTATYLRRFYLMRCHDITRSYGLPTQQFSPKLRCSHCCQEWKHGTYKTKITSTKLSKKQRRKLRSYKISEKSKGKRVLLDKNQLERTCSICQHTTTISMTKPVNPVIKQNPVQNVRNTNSTAGKPNIIKNTVPYNLAPKKIGAVNVYSHSKDVFSLQNKDNILVSTLKDTPKVIKNNKKKKDKFAGLCKEAVMASAKKSKDRSSQNKLDLFLKPSS